MFIEKGYSGPPGEQVHWRMLTPEKVTAPDLFCFHPAPFSGLAFTTIMQELAVGRRVIAPDYPGYGGSDKTDGPASIEKYARAMGVVFDALSEGAVTLCGFHTGCFVAAQLCLERSANIQKSVLIDVPAFDEEKRQSTLSVFGKFEITEDLDCLKAAWASTFVKRLNSQPKERAFELFVEQLRPASAVQEAFVAAFSYPWEERLSQLTTPSRVLASQSSLLEASRQAADTISSADLVERLDVKRAVLDEAAVITAAEVLKFLNDD